MEGKNPVFVRKTSNVTMPIIYTSAKCAQKAVSHFFPITNFLKQENFLFRRILYA